jgi:hypothetical protein
VSNTEQEAYVPSTDRSLENGERSIASSDNRGGQREVLELARLIENKLSAEVGASDQLGPDELDRFLSFVQHRFTGRLIAYEKGDRWFGWLDNGLNFASILAGAAVAVLSGLGAEKGIVIALGAVVALLQSVSQWAKPAQNASSRGQAASRLRDEGWDFVFDADRYTAKHLDRTWPIFYRQVNKIAREEDEAEDKRAQVGVAATGGSTGSSQPSLM